MKLKRFFGDKAFYRSILAVALPIMLQNGITNFVSLLDNIMVGRLCTESMSGVSIVNQFLFIFYLVIFGTVAGAGIFSAQFHGSGDTEGVRNTFRLKTVLCFLCGVAGICVFFFFGDG
ncbi:MAG: MATE family efflux transporter, partial [Clostridia bacterium]|nr:MATE family efflux transporter [Clostridia bacterium]